MGESLSLILDDQGPATPRSRSFHGDREHSEHSKWRLGLTNGADKGRGVSASPLDILRNTFGFQHFRGVQEQVIGRVMAGARTLAVMPTGSGKSLCYQVPALALRRDRAGRSRR